MGCTKLSRATIDFGVTTSYGTQLNATAGDGNGTAISPLPSAHFPNLVSGQTYHYRITLSDNAGNQRIYPDQTFKVGDTVPPEQIRDLRLSRTSSTALRLTFTAPGNQGRYGQAASYDLRYSTSPLTIYNWPTATKITSIAAPHTAGTAETINLSGFASGTNYYFGIKATDAAGNASLLSNLVADPQGPELLDLDGDGYGAGSSLGSDCDDYDNTKHAISSADISGYCVGDSGTGIGDAVPPAAVTNLQVN